jgi:hypothetical protein
MNRESLSVSVEKSPQCDEKRILQCVGDDIPGQRMLVEPHIDISVVRRAIVYTFPKEKRLRGGRDFSPEVFV